MRNLPSSIRLFLLSIPLFAAILLQSWKLESSWGLPVVSTFLELQFPSLQGKFLSHERFSPAIRRESATVGRWIAANPRTKDWSAEYIRDLSLFIVLKSREFQLSPYLVVSIIHVESSFDTLAISPKGAVGLMQLMPATARALAADKGIPFQGDHSLVDPKLNIYLGLHYMNELRAKFPKNQELLTAYNMGPAALARKLRAGDEVSFKYYEKVMGTMSQMERETRKKGKISWL